MENRNIEYQLTENEARNLIASKLFIQSIREPKKLNYRIYNDIAGIKLKYGLNSSRDILCAIYHFTVEQADNCKIDNVPFGDYFKFQKLTNDMKNVKFFPESIEIKYSIPIEGQQTINFNSIEFMKIILYAIDNQQQFIENEFWPIPVEIMKSNSFNLIQVNDKVNERVKQARKIANSRLLSFFMENEKHLSRKQIIEIISTIYTLDLSFMKNDKDYKQTIRKEFAELKTDKVWTLNSFFEVYENMLREFNCSNITAYRKTEEEHKQENGRTKYKNYDSFRVVYNRKIKK